jgi:ribosomal protein S18 acetylase RimI-like enzyme
MEIVEEGPDVLSEYGTVPSSFTIMETLDVGPAQGDTLPTLKSRRLASPIVKDYDASPGDAPVDWAARFDLSGWRFVAARMDGQRVGGAAVVMRPQGVDLLEGRNDLALLWDIRVEPTVRRSGVGSALLRAVEECTRAAGLVELKVETQNNNVPACRFYARHGFQLRQAVWGAYTQLPSEVQLLWYKRLDALARYSPDGSRAQ